MKNPDQHKDNHDEEEVLRTDQLLPPDFQSHLHQQSHRRRRHAGQHHRNLGIMAQRHVSKSERGDNERSGQDHPKGCHQRTRRPAQFAADNHAHVRGVQTG